MGLRGSKPQPTALKVARGTLRARDKGRFDAVPVSGAPERPADLTAVGVELWDRIVAEHSDRGTLGEIDTAALTVLCRTYELHLAAWEKAKIEPTDKDARCSYLGYLAACDKLGAKFGWTVGDRANMKTGSKDSKPKVPTRNRTA